MALQRLCHEMATHTQASIIDGMSRVPCTVVIALLCAGWSHAQTPQPFPRPGAQTPQAPPLRTQPNPQVTPPAAPPQQPAGVPTGATLGVAIYPGAQFLGSYDAGRGQRYFLFGTNAGFADVVGYYQTQVGERGDLVLKDPPTHQFHGDPFVRFREETMVFPPGVTVKDFTAGGAQGYPNPKPGVQPARFSTILMIVTPPPPSPGERR
jgi:hypothetical protein